MNKETQDKIESLKKELKFHWEKVKSLNKQLAKLKDHPKV